MAREVVRMYSYEDRIRAVKLYIQYDLSAAAVIRELGYPKDRHSLPKWYKEYKSTGNLKKTRPKASKYSADQRYAAVSYYLAHGKNMSKTIKALGYPGRSTLSMWLQEDSPAEKRYCKSSRPKVYLTQKQREQVAIELCVRTGSAQEIADKYHISRYSVYNCKWQLFGKGECASMPKNNAPDAVNATPDDAAELRAEVEQLKREKEELNRQVFQLQLERDVLTVAAEVLKKRRGRQSMLAK